MRIEAAKALSEKNFTVPRTRRESTMGLFAWFQKGACCARCGKITLTADATMTPCCHMKLCDAKCLGAWKADAFAKSRCPDCKRRLNKESGMFEE